MVPRPKGENGPHAVASSDLRSSPTKHVNYSKEFFTSVLVEKDMVFDLGNWAACGECWHLHSSSAELDNKTPINVLITDNDAAATYGRPQFTGLPVGGTRDSTFPPRNEKDLPQVLPAFFNKIGFFVG